MHIKFSDLELTHSAPLNEDLESVEISYKDKIIVAIFKDETDDNMDNLKIGFGINIENISIDLNDFNSIIEEAKKKFPI